MSDATHPLRRPHSSRHAATFDAATRRALLADERLLGTVHRLYAGYDLVRLADQPSPITVFPADEAQWDDLDAPLAPLTSDGLDTAPGWWRFDPTARADYERYLRQQDAHTNWNGPTYRLVDMRRHATGIKLACGVGWFFEALATCDVLSDELLSAFAARDSFEVSLDDLPRRAWIHERTTDPVTHGGARSAALSVATVTMYKTESSYRRESRFNIILSPRARWVASHSDCNHVVPAGMFQPLHRMMARDPNEFSVRTAVLRELLEELYGHDEGRNGSASVRHPCRAAELASICAMLNDGRAELLYTGISVNLLTLRPEICTLLLIHDPTWIKDPSLRLSREYGIRYRGSGKRLASISVDARFHIPSDRRLRARALAPNAAAALYLGLRVAATKT